MFRLALDFCQLPGNGAASATMMVASAQAPATQATAALYQAPLPLPLSLTAPELSTSAAQAPTIKKKLSIPIAYNPPVVEAPGTNSGIAYTAAAEPSSTSESAGGFFGSLFSRRAATVGGSVELSAPAPRAAVLTAAAPAEPVASVAVAQSQPQSKPAAAPAAGRDGGAGKRTAENEEEDKGG